jgi:hypothetical protein
MLVTLDPGIVEPAGTLASEVQAAHSTNGETEAQERGKACLRSEAGLDSRFLNSVLDDVEGRSQK